MFISSFLSNSYRHFLLVVWRTGAWHWWCCKQLKIRRWVGVGKRALWMVVSASCLTWHGDLSCFQRWRHQSCFGHRVESQQTATVQNLNGWMSLFCCCLLCFKPASASQSHRRVFLCRRSLALLSMRRSCTRLPRSGFVRCTACRWALRCTSWSCWYWGWTWLWTDWWPPVWGRCVGALCGPS